MFFVILDSCGELLRAATSRLYVSTILPFEYLLPLLSQEGSPTGRGGLNERSVIPFIHATKLQNFSETTKHFANFFH